MYVHRVVKMAWYGDVLFEQWAVTEFLVAEKESLTNIHRWLKTVYGVNAVNKGNVGHWASQIAGSEKGQAELNDAHHPGHYFFGMQKG
jgi:hypothetical protein